MTGTERDDAFFVSAPVLQINANHPILVIREVP